MFGILIQKELKNILLSPKFVTTFATLFILILLSVSIGINEYFSDVQQYNTATRLAEDGMKSASSWRAVQSKSYRKPDPMQIFVAGTNRDIGRFSNISDHSEVKLKNSSYSDDPIFAIFRQVDFTLIVTIVFSLFAMLFTYNTINGEREGGTLKLIFSYPVSRFQFLAAKIIGSWLGLVLPVLLPILIGMLMLIIFNVPMTTINWISLITLIIISIFYFTFFIVLGVAVSASTKNSSISFSILLVIWIVSVFIVPRIGVMTAGQMIEVPSIAQLESRQDSYSKERWNLYFNELTDVMEKRNSITAGMTEAQKKEFEDDMSYQYMVEDDKRRKQAEKDIADYAAKLHEDFRNKKIQMEKTALTLSRISPASSYMLAAMNLAYTDIQLKNRYEDSMIEYKKNFTDYVSKKESENGQSGMFKISLSSEGGMKLDDGRKEGGIDVSEVPRYSPPTYTFAEVFQPAVFDMGIIAIFMVVFFAAAFLQFRRYDLR